LKVSKRAKKGLFLLYADVDNLKAINDTYGHKEGDRVLVEIAYILKDNYRESDIIARIGGDEFVVIPVGSEGDDTAVITARLKKCIEVHNAKVTHRYKVSISAGISYYDPLNPCSVHELLARGDQAMYEQKNLKRKLQLSVSGK
jgi:diguanylate cyclase (GGDEF)-like protein